MLDIDSWDSNKVCEEVCACIHASLIAGDLSCVYTPEDELKGYYELDFWENDLKSDSEYISILKPLGFDAVFMYYVGDDNEPYIYSGTWHEILHLIGTDYIDYYTKLAEDHSIRVLFNGQTYVLLFHREVISSNNCPITFEAIMNVLATDKDEFRSVRNLIASRRDTYHRRRVDSYETDNMKSTHSCCECGVSLNEDEAYHDNDSDCFCENCFYEIYTYCECCDELVNQQDSYYKDSTNYCECCYYDSYSDCCSCGEEFDIDLMVYDEEDGEYYCEDCMKEIKEERKQEKEEAEEVVKQGDTEGT